tara:strand:+ start:837 stop:1418 length:582 start_codon:yes stop_codon:yes gene_type:complete
MNNNLRKNLILFSILSILIIVKVVKDRSNYTISDEIFDGNKDKIKKILLHKGSDAIELIKENEIWKIAGNDTLIVRENRIEDLYNKVLETKKETLISENKEKWTVLSVDDSLGTHLALYDKDDIKLAYYVFGRSNKDWKHNYVRIDEEPDVYLTNHNIINNLNPRDSFWGEKPKPIEVDSVESNFIENKKENK